MTQPSDDRQYLEQVDKVHEFLLLREDSEALVLAEKLIQDHPDKSNAYFMLALYAFMQRNFGDAIELLNSAHERDPECREYVDCLAILYTVTGKLSDGLYFAKLATALDSDPKVLAYIPDQLSNYFEALDRIHPAYHYVAAMTQYNTRRFEDAARSCEMELKQNETHDRAYTLLGRCHLQLGNYDKAVNALHAAINLNPEKGDNYRILGSALCHLGRFDEAMNAHGTALERDPESVAFATAAAADADYLPDSGEPVRAEIRGQLAERLADAERTELDIARVEGRKDRIRVGYLSNAFHDSEAALFLSALLRNHDRSRFEVYCYQQSIVEDTVTVELKNMANSWREIFDIGDPVLNIIMSGDEIDVLVDLCGFTDDNRAGLMATHAVPVQFAWLEPPWGIGCKGIDRVLSDPLTRDADRSAIAKGQDLAVIDGGLLALEPFTFFPAVEDLRAVETGTLVFGGHCDLARLTSETASLWSRALHASGRSKLMLGDAGAVSGAVKNHVIDLFSHHGTADRVVFWDDDPMDHLRIEFFGQIDVLLDTYPVSGRLNLCKALWMGVPVLSLKGRRRVSQMGASLLRSAGLDEWICESAENLAETAAGFADDLDALAKTRRGLRDRVTAASLFKPKALAESVEAAFEAALADERKGAGMGKKKTAKKAAAKKAPKKAPKKAGAKGGKTKPKTSPRK